MAVREFEGNPGCPLEVSALQLLVMLCEKGRHRLKELIEGRCPLQHHMVVSGQFDEARVIDEPGDPAALLKRRNMVTRAVKHQSGDANPFRQFGRVDAGVHIPQPERVLRAGGDALEFIEFSRDIGRGVGKEIGGEKATENGIRAGSD